MQLIHLNTKEIECIRNIFPDLIIKNFNDVLELTSRIHLLALHDGNSSPKSQSCFDILEQIKKYKALRCVEYSYLLSQVLITHNIPSRVIGLKKKTVETDEYGAGHVVVEFWSGEFNKWVMIDPQYAVYFMHNEIPLSCLEITNMGISNTICTKVKNSRLSENDIEKYKLWLDEYLYYIDTAVLPNQNITDEQRISELKYILIPKNTSAPKIFQRTSPILTQVIDTNAFYQSPDSL